MLAAVKAFADEQGGDGALSPELSRILIDDDYANWMVIPGSNGQTLRIKPLLDRFKEMPAETSATLLRIEDGYVVPPHSHPEGEFNYVMAGTFIQDSDKPEPEQKVYQKGDYIWMPPGSVHGIAKAGKDGATVLSMKPKKAIPL